MEKWERKKKGKIEKGLLFKTIYKEMKRRQKDDKDQKIIKQI